VIATSDTQGTCRVCARSFIKFNSMQLVCGLKCAQRIPVIQRKEEAADFRRRKEAIKPRSKWLSEAQTAFNAWVRIRDAHRPCISCGRHHQGEWHAGHYLSTGARPELRFDEANVHKQCQPCNTHLHGNLVLYRAELIRRIGQPEVDRLEGPQKQAKLGIPELREIRDRYRRLTKEAKAAEAVEA